MAWAETSMQVGHSLRLAIAALVVSSSVALAARRPSPPCPRAGSGTIAFAEAPGANPNFIFPYLGCAYSSVNNINQFQMLMYRPLYWFGLGASTAFVPVALARESTGLLPRRPHRDHHDEGLALRRRPGRQRALGHVLLEHVQGRPDRLLRLQRRLRNPRPGEERRRDTATRCASTSRRRSIRTGSSTTTSPRSRRCRTAGTARRARGPRTARRRRLRRREHRRRVQRRHDLSHQRGFDDLDLHRRPLAGG